MTPAEWFWIAAPAVFALGALGYAHLVALLFFMYSDDFDDN